MACGGGILKWLVSSTTGYINIVRTPCDSSIVENLHPNLWWKLREFRETFHIGPVIVWGNIMVELLFLPVVLNI
jgi:hypothetical protein